MSLAEFLAGRGAATMPHPGGTLATHLERVGDRLAGHGAREPVVLAARAHAAYGTDHFDHPLLDRGTERPVLVGLIGAEAEVLVHRYCATARDLTWPGFAADRVVHDRWTGATTRLDAVAAREFLDLTVVNELDVVEHGGAAAGPIRDQLVTLLPSWAPLLTPSVLADASSSLGSVTDKGV